MIPNDSMQDNLRVVSCSRDFSLRVYRWSRTQEKPVATSGRTKEEGGVGVGVGLESRYTLLGGSVALKTQYVNNGDYTIQIA